MLRAIFLFCDCDLQFVIAFFVTEQKAWDLTNFENPMLKTFFTYKKARDFVKLPGMRFKRGGYKGEGIFASPDGTKLPHGTPLLSLRVPL